MAKTELLVDGVWRSAEGSATFEHRRLVSQDTVTQAADASVADAEAIGSAAAAAQGAWAQTGPSARRGLLNEAANRLEHHKDEFINRMISEVGATRGWAEFNVRLGASMLREAGAATTHLTGEIIPSDIPGSFAMAERKAAGTVLGIAPWNAPVILGVRAVAMPLACGNAAILKGSELCPATHELICRALTEAGFPKGVVGFLTHRPANAPQVVGALIDHPGVRRINFTGSTQVGRKIAVQAAQALKPVLLELGGKAPFVVLEDADIDAAVNAAAFGAFMNQGQICMSTERIIVDKAIAADFAEKLVHKTSGLKAGDAGTADAVLGEVVSEAAIERINALVEDARGKGAHVHREAGSQGAVLQPTILDGVTPDMRIFYEETFGPVVSIVHANNQDAAIAIANDTEYGLSSAVFSTSIDRAMAVADQLETGICHINGPTVHDEAQMPFGGVKSSGFGRFGGKAGIDAFTQLRWTTIQRGSRHYPF